MDSPLLARVSSLRLSTSGKSLIIASTEGNVSIPEKEEVKIGLNIYRKP
jgi:hypothetical protein